MSNFMFIRSRVFVFLWSCLFQFPIQLPDMVNFAMEKKKGAGVVMEKLDSGFVMELLNEKGSGFVDFDGESVEVSLGCDEMEGGDGDQTPKGSIFDPFAPATEELELALALAPMKKKVEMETKYPLRRQLDFESCVENVVDGGGDEDEEECLFEGLHAELFDFIVTTQLDEMADRDPVPVTGCQCSTPSSVRLTGVAETCPDAPKRARLVVRRDTVVLCRKLVFGSDSS